MGRKKKKFHFIYKTTNVLNGKYYLGMHSTSNLDDGYMGSGKRLRYSINKYGEDNHKVEILEFVDTREELKTREAEIVNLNEIAKVECMNLIVGGEGGFTQEQQVLNAKKSNEKQRILREDPEWVEKKSKAMTKTLKEQWDKGDRTQLPPAFKGEHSEETKKKMSESSKGKGKGNSNSQFGKCWITNGKESKKIYKGDDIPNGWSLGRKMKFKL